MQHFLFLGALRAPKLQASCCLFDPPPLPPPPPPPGNAEMPISAPLRVPRDGPFHAIAQGTKSKSPGAP